MKYILFLLLPIWVFANTIFTNGAIYTVNPKLPWAEALVVEKSKIVYVGSNKGALYFKNSTTKLVDLNKRFMMPGIIDSHTHTAMAALLLNSGVNVQAAIDRNTPPYDFALF
jgi:predicted amidohydrolase YtcJ